MRLLKPAFIGLWTINVAYAIAYHIWPEIGDWHVAQRLTLAGAFTATVALILREIGAEYRVGHHIGYLRGRNERDR